MTLIVPNLVLANTEPYSLWTVEALILMPLGFYMMWSVALRRSGVMIWLAFPFIFFCAFQIVLLYLFGNSVIATDMFTNVLTTNPGEAGELLGNIYPAVVLVCAMYLPLLWLAAREIGLKRYISRTTRLNVGLTGAAIFAVGMLALWPAYRASEDRHVLRDEIFPLNVFYNLGLSGSEFRKSHDFEKSSEGFSYAPPADGAGPRARSLYLRHRRGIARDELAALRLRPRDEPPPVAGPGPRGIPQHADTEQYDAQKRAADPLFGEHRRTRGACTVARDFRRCSTKPDSTHGSSPTSRGREP